MEWFVDQGYFLLMGAAGVYATLMGFRVIRGSRADPERYESWWRRFGKHLRWLGPILVVAAGVRLALG